MQTRKNDLAFPYLFEQEDGSQVHETGLTKREYFAAMALQGILSNPEFMQTMAVSLAVQSADKLIFLLNQTANEN